MGLSFSILLYTHDLQHARKYGWISYHSVWHYISGSLLLLHPYALNNSILVHPHSPTLPSHLLPNSLVYAAWDIHIFKYSFSDQNNRVCQDTDKEWYVSEEVGHLRAHLVVETEVIYKVETRCTPKKIQLQMHYWNTKMLFVCMFLYEMVQHTYFPKSMKLSRKLNPTIGANWEKEMIIILSYLIKFMCRGMNF
jgi:hypothetical protein